MNNQDFLGYKLKLYPTPEQKQLFNRYFGAARFVYNFGINLQKEHFKKFANNLTKRKLIGRFDMIKELNKLRKIDSYKWLNDFDNGSINMIFKDVVDAYSRYFQGLSKKPKYKKKKAWSNQKFAVRADRVSIFKDYIKLPSIGIVYCGNHNYNEIIGTGNYNAKKLQYKPYHNVRITFDGYNYWIGFALPISDEIFPNSNNRFKNNEVWINKPVSKGIGIDINAHHDTWIVISDGTTIQRPRTLKEDKQIKKYQRKLSIKRNINKEKKPNSTVANELEEPNYTKNEEKVLKKLNKAYKKRTNKTLNTIHECACDILQKKPEYVIMETLSVSSMIFPISKNISYKYRKRHNSLINSAMIYTVQFIIDKKLSNNNIPVFYADKEYPSSQLCSKCGHRQNIGTKRIYECPYCENIIDRDLNASINLSNYLDYNVMELIS